ncbi:UPF0236 family protein, partial [Dehalococcoidales bacterium]|nr:UPF0236 family protein [Dehalococcoidales bacterium]
LQEIETKKLEEAKGKVSCREKVPRYLFTRLGLIRFERHKVKYKEKGKFGFLLDDVLGIRPYQTATRWVKQRALELAVEYPFRQAMSLIRHEIGDEISHRTIHRWAQEEGKKLRDEEEARQEAVFGRAEKVRNDGKEREIVVLEVDGTMIHSQEKGEDDFEAKLAIMYSGKELESRKAKHKRYRLKEKVIYGGIEGADDFGERLYIQGEQKLSLSLAKNLLLISDGARWISDIAGADYFKATYQLDWWHYERKLRAALPGEEKLQQELMSLLWEGKREEHRNLLKLKRLVDGPSEKLDDLLGYLEENWDGIYGSRNLKSKVGAREVLVVGSGGVEKNIDLILCRRFKGRGMSWSRAGAQNLLKLRLLSCDRRDWKAYWRRRLN